MDKSRYCLYLPGICMHVSPVSTETGKSELHLDVNPFPKGFAFHLLQPPAPHLHPALHSSIPPETTALPTMASASSSALPSPAIENPDGCELAKLICADKAFENTSTSVAASQMRNALNNLADTVTDPEQKKVRFAHDSLHESKLIYPSSSRLRWTTSSRFSADT